MTSFGGRCPYFWLCLLLAWQDLQDLTYFRMVVRIPFQYITDLIVSLRRECPGCWRQWWYQLTALSQRDVGMITFPFLHSTLVSSIRWIPMSFCGIVAFFLKQAFNSWSLHCASAISVKVRDILPSLLCDVQTQDSNHHVCWCMSLHCLNLCLACTTCLRPSSSIVSDCYCF